jgi:hypothetical protein
MKKKEERRRGGLPGMEGKVDWFGRRPVVELWVKTLVLVAEGGRKRRRRRGKSCGRVAIVVAAMKEEGETVNGEGEMWWH